jgi:TetR/AcrR family transcriptional regulator, cholesterol catabolism regulator
MSIVWCGTYRQVGYANEPKVATGTPKTVRDTRSELLEVATRMFYEHGYEKTALSDLAQELGIKKASIYHYIESKEDLLEIIMWESCEAIMLNMEAMSGHGGDPAQRLFAFSLGHVTKVLENPWPTAIFERDFGALSKGRQKRILSRRDGYEQFLIEILEEGRDVRLFSDQASLFLTSRAILGMLTSSHVWFRAGRELASSDVAHEFARFALQIAGASPIDVSRVADVQSAASLVAP